MKKSEKIHVRMSFEEEIIKNLLQADSDLARRLDSIRRSEKVKEAYASAKQEVKKKAAEAVAKGVKVNLKKVGKAFADGVHCSFTIYVLGIAINESVENDIQKSLKRYMLENMTDDLMLEIIEKVRVEQIETIEEIIHEAMFSNRLKNLIEDIFAENEEE